MTLLVSGCSSSAHTDVTQTPCPTPSQTAASSPESTLTPTSEPSSPPAQSDTPLPTAVVTPAATPSQENTATPVITLAPTAVVTPTPTASPTIMKLPTLTATFNPPTQISPIGGKILYLDPPFPITVTWATVPNAKHYHVYIYYSTDNTQWLGWWENYTDTTSFTAPTMPGPGYVRWHVEAWTADYKNATGYGDWAYFRMVNKTLMAPVLTSPANSTTILTSTMPYTVTFKWTSDSTNGNPEYWVSFQVLSNNQWTDLQGFYVDAKTCTKSFSSTNVWIRWSVIATDPQGLRPSSPASGWSYFRLKA